MIDLFGNKIEPEYRSPVLNLRNEVSFPDPVFSSVMHRTKDRTN